MYCFVLLLVLISAEAQVTINRLKPSGVLFEPVSSAYVYQSHWNIFTNISYVDADETMSLVLSCEDSVEKLCNIQEQDNKFCLHWHKAIKNVVNKIKGQLYSINLYLNSDREKREIFDGIGKISKYLFGTMDSKDAEDIYARLQRLEEHDKDSIHLLNKQVTIMKANFETISKAFQNMSEFQSQVEVKMNDFSRKVDTELNKMSLELRAVHLQTDLNELFIYILTILQSVHSHINEYFTIINSLQQHRLHPLIFSPKILVQTYSEISKGAHSLLVDFHLLNQIIEVRYEPLSREKNLLIRIKLPLIEEEKFTLTKIHLFPIQISGHNAIFDIETSIVLNNTAVNHFIALTNEEFIEHCTKCNSRNHLTVHICAQKQIKYIGGERNNCLSNLLHNSFQKENSCKLRGLGTNIEFLVKLARQNSWLFSFQSARSLLAHCNKITSHHEINGTGILNLDQPCQYTLGTVEIPFESNDEITIPFQQPEPEIIPQPLILQKFSANKIANHKTIPSTTPIPLIQRTHYNYNSILKVNSKSLDEFQSELSEIEKNRKDEILNHQVNTNSGVLSIIFLTLLVLTTLYLRNKCRKEKEIVNVSTICKQEKSEVDNTPQLKKGPEERQTLAKLTKIPESPREIIQNNIPTPPPLPQFQIHVQEKRPTGSNDGKVPNMKLRKNLSFRVKV